MNEFGFLELNSIEAEQIVKNCKKAGWSVFFLSSDISSKVDFFEGVKSIFPLDPPMKGAESWDALSDSLWGGLDSLPAKNFLVLWPNFSKMQKFSPHDFCIAKDIFNDVASTLHDCDLTVGVKKNLLVLGMP